MQRALFPCSLFIRCEQTGDHHALSLTYVTNTCYLSLPVLCCGLQVLQVISACAMAFAHGANDVANAIGSFAAALMVYKTFKVPSSNR